MRTTLPSPLRLLRTAAALLVLSPLLLAGPALVRADIGIEAPTFMEFFDHGRLDTDPGWRHDEQLQQRLGRAVHALGLDPLVEQGRLGVALIDLSEPSQPRLAEINGADTMYAASVPKIAALYAAYQAEREGRLVIDEDFRETLTDMVRVSSNEAASEAIARVGFPYIASLLWQSGLYDPEMGGGLWLGKAFGGVNDRWHRDPVANASHGASPLACAKMLCLIEQGRLVDGQASAEMKAILGDPGIEHKFVKGLRTARPGSRVYRKSGSWRQWHGDAAIIESEDKRYVAVALCESETGGEILERLIVALDDCIAPSSRLASAAPAALAPLDPPVGTGAQGRASRPAAVSGL